MKWNQRTTLRFETGGKTSDIPSLSSGERGEGSGGGKQDRTVLNCNNMYSVNYIMQWRPRLTICTSSCPWEPAWGAASDSRCGRRCHSHHTARGAPRRPAPRSPHTPCSPGSASPSSGSPSSPKQHHHPVNTLSAKLLTKRLSPALLQSGPSVITFITLVITQPC